LKYLSGYEADHHSRYIADLIPDIVELEVPELHIYLDSRMIADPIYKHIDKGIIKDDGIGELSLWF